MTTYAVHQPNFLPWLGYFAKRHIADVWVYLDDVQMPGGNSYVHRVKIADPGGREIWLSLKPEKSFFGKKISETGFAESQTRLLDALVRLESGAHSDFLDLTAALRQALGDFSDFASLNIFLNDWIWQRCFGADPIRSRAVYRSSVFAVEATGDARLAEIGYRVGCVTYVSGMGGDNYQSEATYHHRGIALKRFSPALALAGDLGGQSVAAFIRKHGYSGTAAIIRDVVSAAELSSPGNLPHQSMVSPR